MKSLALERFAGRIIQDVKVTLRECLTSSAAREVALFALSALIGLTPGIRDGALFRDKGSYLSCLSIRPFFFIWNWTVREPIYCLRIVKICLFKATRNCSRTWIPSCPWKNRSCSRCFGFCLVDANHSHSPSWPFFPFEIKANGHKKEVFVCKNRL